MSTPLLDHARWIALWQSLGSTAPGANFELLNCLYAEPHRHYHTAKHIAVCLREFDTYKALAEDPMAVELAIWLHDAIYVPLSEDNEARSAALAVEMLVQADLPDRATQIRNLILATQHVSSAGPDDAGLLIDIDLSVLASPLEQYQKYARAVRKEFHWIPDQQFAAGRIKVLKHFLARPKIYVHHVLQQAWECQARENLEIEIRELYGYGIA
jgi:predicted metal-dependent HD superfamily phosphohydrolase